MLARYRANRAGVVRMPPGDPGASASRPHGVRPTPTIRARILGPSGGPVDPSNPWLACCTLASSRVSVSPTCLPEEAANLGVTMTSSTRRGLNSRPATMTGRSMVRVIWSSASGNPALAAGYPRASYPNTTGNLVSAATSGRAATLAQSNPGWLGSTVAVAGSVRAHSRSKAVWPRRAPAMEVRTVAVASATSRARTASDRQRLSPSRRNQVSVISIYGQPRRPMARRSPRHPCSRVDGLLGPGSKGAGTNGSRWLPTPGTRVIASRRPRREPCGMPAPTGGGLAVSLLRIIGWRERAARR